MLEILISIGQQWYVFKV